MEKNEDCFEIISSTSSERSIEYALTGAQVFLTGATGMLGLALIPRLVFDTPVQKLYALVRGDANRLWTRLDEFLSPETVQRLKDSGKIIAVEGDISKPNSGLSESNAATIRQEVTVIIHAASTLHLKNALSKIAEGVIYPSLAIADLALECVHLTRFVYVSTAYTNAFLQFASTNEPKHDIRISEKIYPLRTDASGGAVAELANIAQFGSTPEYTCMGHPFAYSYAKHLTERLLIQKFNKAGRGDALLLFRPSCFGPAEHLPFPGFEVPGSVPVTTVMALLLALPPFSRVRIKSEVGEHVQTNLDEVPVDVVVDRLIVHIAAATKGVVHAVSGARSRRPIDGLLRAGCQQRRAWWFSPRLIWCDKSTDPTRVSWISKTFGVLGCSLLFGDDQTRDVWRALELADQQKWHLFTDRKAGDVSDFRRRRGASQAVLSGVLKKRYGLPPWVVSVVSKRPC